MPLSTETLPNKALNGRELLEIAVAKFRQSLENDCMFTAGIAYGRIAFTISASFDVASAYMPPFTVRTRTPKEAPIEGDVPLKDAPDSELTAFEAKVAIDNPNVERVAANLPIKVQGRKTTGPSTPDNPFPEIETKEYRYDQSVVPAPPPIKVEDVSARESAKHGKKPGRHRPTVYMGRDHTGETVPASSIDPMDELDAISTEEE